MQQELLFHYLLGASYIPFLGVPTLAMQKSTSVVVAAITATIVVAVATLLDFFHLLLPFSSFLP